MLGVASLRWDKGCVRCLRRLDENSGFYGNRKCPLTYNREDDVSIFSQLFFIRSFSNLQVMRTGIKYRTSSARSDFKMPLSVSNNYHILIMGKWCIQVSLFIFDRIFVQLAGNQKRHKISEDFKFRPDRITSELRALDGGLNFQ